MSDVRFTYHHLVTTLEGGRFPLPTLPPPPPGPSLTFDLVADFGGSLANWTAYVTANLTDINMDVNLTVPSGTYVGDGSNPWSLGFDLAIGRNNTIHIIGQPDRSAIFTNLGNTVGALPCPVDFAGATGVNRIQTAFAGQSYIDLITPSEYVKFTVGDYINIVGDDTQQFGYPQNQQFFEFRRVTSINSITGRIDLEAPLINTYRSTWPYLGGTSPDSCGKATAIPLRHAWGSNYIVEGITLNSPNQIFGECYSIVYRNCTWNTNPVLPTYSESVLYDNVTFANLNSTEIDKFIGTLEFRDCNGSPGLSVQSSSHHHLIVTRGTIGNVGCGRVLTVTDCTLGEILFTPFVAGADESATITNTSIALFNQTFGAVFAQGVGSSIFTMTAGVLAVTKADNQTFSVYRTVVVGGVYILNTTLALAGPCFKITDITEDATNIYYHTNMGSNPPQWASATGIRQHPCPSLTVTGCPGPPIGFASYAEAAGLPLYSYYNSGLLDTATNPVGPNSTMALTNGPGFVFGYLVRLEINVIVPYTGPNPALFVRLTQSGSGGQIFSDATFSSSALFRPLIDAKTAGLRIITPGLNTGIQPNDVVPTLDSNPHWITYLDMFPDVDNDIHLQSSTLWPHFTVKIIVDQAIPI
jgi:hypothetical protein